MRPFLLPTLGTFLLYLMSFYTHSQTMPGILTERQRAENVDAILEDRFENLLPQLMRRDGLDLWVISSSFLTFLNLPTEKGPPKPCPLNPTRFTSQTLK